jgi:two-component system, NtrC family, sensor kinase
VKLTMKIAAVMTAATAVILVALAVVTVRREVGLLEADLRRDATLLSQGMAAAASSLWQVQGPSRTLEMLAAVDRAEGAVEISWLAPERALLLAEALDSVASQEMEERGLAGEARLVSVAPVKVEGVLVGAVRVSESLGTRDAYVGRTLRSISGTVLAVTVLSGLLAILLGRLLVGRRVVALVARADEIARGEFGVALPTTASDELSDLVTAVNRMSDQLAAAQGRVQAELEGRLEAEVQLRHAARLATVGQLAAGVAHELGTPLNVISGRAGLILTRLEQGHAAAADARIIREQAQRVSRIVRQLLDYARRREPARHSHDLGKLARATVALLQPQASERSVTLELAIDEATPPRAMVDAGQIQQVLTNLVVNAVQASPVGSTVVVSIGPGPAAESARVEVTDHGEGIGEADLERVFAPFFTTKQPGEGTGLGLAVALGIVQDHGGSISVQSTVGRGSRFTVEVPRGETA